MTIDQVRKIGEQCKYEVIDVVRRDGQWHKPLVLFVDVPDRGKYWQSYADESQPMDDELIPFMADELNETIRDA